MTPLISQATGQGTTPQAAPVNHRASPSVVSAPPVKNPPDGLSAQATASSKSLVSETHSLDFSIDADTKKVIVKIVDTTTKEVVKQIPDEEVIEVARAINRLRGSFVNAKV